MVAGAKAISGFPSGTFVTPAALAAVLASYVTSNAPTWNVVSGTAPTYNTGLWVISRDENNAANSSGSPVGHVTVPGLITSGTGTAGSVWNLATGVSGGTAVTSPYTMRFPFPVMLSVTTAGTVSSLTIAGVQVASSLTTSSYFCVPAGAAIVTTFSAGPTYKVTPV